MAGVAKTGSRRKDGTPRTQRTADEMREHRLLISRWAVQGGVSQREMGERLGITRDLVKNDLHAVREMWAAETKQNRQTLLAQELAQLDALIASGWQGWRSSLQEAVRTSTLQNDYTESSEGGPPPEAGSPAASPQTKKRTTRRASVTKNARDGNPEFLSIVQRAVEQRAKLLGLDKPATEAERDDQTPYIPPHMFEQNEKYVAEVLEIMERIEAEEGDL